MKLQIKKDATDQTVFVFIPDSSSSTGAGLTGLTNGSSGLVCYYIRPGGSATALSLASLAAIDSAHSDGGFKEASSANMPGVYRLDLSDAIVASGVSHAVVMLKGATNMAPVVLEIQLVEYDPASYGSSVADALLARDIGSGSGAGSLNERTVRSALRALRNKFTVSGTDYTVYKEDDSTTAWASTVTTNANADPITASDPT